MTPLRWTLIGASDIAASRMVPAMRALGHEVVGVMSSSAERAEQYAKDHGIAAHSNDLKVALAWDAEAVYISTTNELHCAQAIAAAQAGRNILCEKPLAMSNSSAAAMLEAARDAGVLLATNHHLRCSATIRAVAALVREGRVGRLVSLRINHAVLLPERLRGWRLNRTDAGSGVVLDITVHDADTLRFITGDEIERVGTILANTGLASGGIADAAMNVMRLRSGALATTHEAFTTPYATTGVEVHGTEGSIVATGVLTQDPVGTVRLRDVGGESEVDVGEREDPYVVGLREFEAAVHGVGQPAASAEDGAASLAVALAALESASEKVFVAPAFAPTPAAVG